MSNNLDRFIQRVTGDCVNAKRVTAADEAEGNDAMAWRFTEKADDCVNAKPAVPTLRDTVERIVEEGWWEEAEAILREHEQARQRDVRDAIRRLAPYLNRYCDQGWPGLSERERDDATNARWDLLTAAGIS